MGGHPPRGGCAFTVSAGPLQRHAGKPGESYETRPASVPVWADSDRAGLENSRRSRLSSEKWPGTWRARKPEGS
jgi:hypothetical protein